MVAFINLVQRLVLTFVKIKTAIIQDEVILKF